MTWTWRDTLEHFREEPNSTTTFDYLQAMAEQIEANRKAIEHLQKSMALYAEWAKQVEDQLCDDDEDEWDADQQLN